MTCMRCQFEIGEDSQFCRKCGAPVSAAEAESATRTVFVPASEFAAGKVLAGKYCILEIAGRGGMGIVYKAQDTKLQRPVALKFLRARIQESPLRPEEAARIALEVAGALEESARKTKKVSGPQDFGGTRSSDPTVVERHCRSQIRTGRCILY